MFQTVETLASTALSDFTLSAEELMAIVMAHTPTSSEAYDVERLQDVLAQQDTQAHILEQIESSFDPSALEAQVAAGVAAGETSFDIVVPISLDITTESSVDIDINVVIDWQINSTDEITYNVNTDVQVRGNVSEMPAQVETVVNEITSGSTWTEGPATPGADPVTGFDYEAPLADQWSVSYQGSGQTSDSFSASSRALTATFDTEDDLINPGDRLAFVLATREALADYSIVGDNYLGSQVTEVSNAEGSVTATIPAGVIDAWQRDNLTNAEMGGSTPVMGAMVDTLSGEVLAIGGQVNT